jgi:hypothetical protein
MKRSNRKKLKIVLSHIFSRKTISYIFLTLVWTMAAVMFWGWVNKGELVLFESLEITLTIMAGKMVLYGIWDYLHLPPDDDDDSPEVIAQYDENGDKFGEYCIL